VPSRWYPSIVDRATQSPPETRILKVAPDEPSEEQELSFELDFLAGLTVQARFELMFERSRQMAEALEANGHRAPSSILKRS
jgi:hypothetical protein